MCVNTKFSKWERPAVASDITAIKVVFPNADLETPFKVMSKNGFQPLTTDLVLLAAMQETPADDLGMKYVPFSGLDSRTGEIVKLPVMDQVVEWCENTALGADMWKEASDYMEETHGTRIHFAMNCGCGLVATKNYKNGIWNSWLKRFNQSRHDVVGRTVVTKRETDSIVHTDIKPHELLIWKKMRIALESLPAIETVETKIAA